MADELPCHATPVSAGVGVNSLPLTSFDFKIFSKFLHPVHGPTLHSAFALTRPGDNKIDYIGKYVSDNDMFPSYCQEARRWAMPCATTFLISTSISPQDHRRYPNPLPTLAYMRTTFERPNLWNPTLSFFATPSFIVINILCISTSCLPLHTRLSQAFSSMIT